MRTGRLAGVLLLALLVGGCAGMAGRAERGAPSMAAAPELDLMAKGGEGAPEAPAAVAATTRSRPAAPQGQPAEDGTGQPAARRLRVYTGYLELVVNEVERARERVIEAAGQLGGYVESTTTEYVVLRVPASRLEEAMEIVSGLGEVRARSIETSDVTDQYADLGRRIEISRRTRERLYTLLDRATDVDERVAILREIRRLTEEIEGMSSALTVLAGQIDLSRLTVRTISRIEAGSEGGPRIPFPWIAGLGPLEPSGRASKTPIVVVLPAEYAVFDSGDRIRAEAADGTRLAVGVVPNEPRGDTAFWRDALRWHLGALYRSTDPIEAGRLEGAVFVSKDIVPFHYLVAVVVRGEELVVAEAFFPDAAARERRLDGIRAALEGWKP